MVDANDNDLESKDKERIEEAVTAIAASDYLTAKKLLISIINNAPEDYSYTTEAEDGSLTIRFWNQAEFLHYVTWQKPSQSIYWKVGVYPRAFFYLGFIAVAEGNFEKAIHYLDRGAELEPTNPKFRLEKAQALIRNRDYSAALKLLNQNTTVGPHIDGKDVAAALRGKGSALIELQELLEAEAAFRESLELDPDSKVAQNELNYISQLRGGRKADTNFQTTTSSTNSTNTCTSCGNTVTNGTVIQVKGSPVMVCDACKDKLTKKSWQFWR